MGRDLGGWGSDFEHWAGPGLKTHIAGKGPGGGGGEPRWGGASA